MIANDEILGIHKNGSACSGRFTRNAPSTLVGKPSGRASSYPEIITAAVSGPEVVDGKEVFTFKTAVGTKS